ncbi:MAG TPA: plastocyanin/azurin family copper-binding protein, partial [Nitrosopumilaceae archaeon]|nr:plastocyanin/azurin family copper-binding protein [Nitrosopumilaceae archaeon]
TVTIQKGGTVTWSNDDTAAHTVTSGGPTAGPSGMFDSSLVMGGKTFQFTFDKAGTYDYFCMVHPWMTGTVKVG